MLDQFRHDLSNDSNDSQDSRFQMSRKKFVYTLSGAALALVLFLFLIGAFRNDSTELLVVNGNSDYPTTKQDESELQRLQTRVNRIEDLLSKQSGSLRLVLDTPQSIDDLNIAFNDDSLKQLIDAQQPMDTLSFSIDAEGIDTPSGIPAPIAPLQPTPPVNMPKPTPHPTPAPTPKATSARTYVVQKGDTLTKISQRLFGTTKRWKEIYDMNTDRIANMNQLKVGTKLTIPDDKK